MPSIERGNEENFRVVLMGIGKDTPQEKEAFCRQVASRYGVALPLLEKIAESLPVVLKKNLSRRRSEALARLIASCGGRVSIEKRVDAFPVHLEFEAQGPPAVALETCRVQETAWGSWSVVGRVRNVSSRGLEDLWALIQLFGEGAELLTFEEVPLVLNPLPPGGAAPFRAIFDGHLPLTRVTISFKNALGRPVAAEDRLKRREWVPVRTILPSNEEEIRDAALDVPVLKLFLRPNGTSEVREETPPVREGQGLHAGMTDPSKAMAATTSPGIEAFWEEGGEDGSDEKVALEGEEAALSWKGVETAPAEEVAEVLQGEPDGSEGPGTDERAESSQAKGLLTVGRDGGARSVRIVKEAPEDDGGKVSEAGRTELSKEKAVSDAALIGPNWIPAVVDSFGMDRAGDEEKGLPDEDDSSFPWIDAFREAIRAYYREDRDGFLAWFRNREGEDRFQDNFHRVLTILAHARFSQRCPSEGVLENTERVYEIMLKEELGIEEIPFLEGTCFTPAETWRNLFFKAVPKLKEIAKHLLSKGQWDAVEMEKVIQIIPQMSPEASRLAVWRLSSLLTNGIHVDFRRTLPLIGGGLYRVASRLGIVDPRFDHCRSSQSVGERKIHAFAKTAFPEHPRMIEEPMNWVGSGVASEGRCLPVHPRCEGCLFEAFCPGLHLDFDPAEKGVFLRV